MCVIYVIKEIFNYASIVQDAMGKQGVSAKYGNKKRIKINETPFFIQIVGWQHMYQVLLHNAISWK